MSGNMIPIAGEQKKRICYFFDSDIGNYHYGPGHPMKPHRIRMTHALVMNYGLYKKMEIFRAKPATRKEMAQFHTDDYVDFLSKVTPDNMDEFLKEQAKFNLGDDCPVFDGLFEYCSISAGGSMEGAARLSRDKCDIAVNWAGGLHHAKKAEANGFCYVNDIVLGILELLRYHKRVLYVDIDVHHGDGVEEAFYTTDRVMTCSFHKYGEFFPGTGELRDTGHGKGKYYAVNFPLRDGITDEAYKNIFEPVITKIMETYQPSAIVLQCGGDSLSGDRLGSFNVSMRGHANCVRFIKSLGLPLLLLGGGGYTIRNVSRTWAYETGLAAGQELCPDIPMNEYYEYYGPTYRLDVPPSNMEDMNVAKYLEKTKIQIFENLRHTIPVPSVGLQAIPRLPHDEMDVDEDLDDPNERKPQRLLDGLIQRDDEFSDSEDEGEGGRRNVQSHKRVRRQSPKFNGNGLLGFHPGSHNSLSHTQRTTADLNFNRLVPSRHSSLSSSATTNMNDIQMTYHKEVSSKNPIPTPRNHQASTLSPHPESQNNEPKSIPSDLSNPSTTPVAQVPTIVDIPMLSQEDQIELQKLASEALASSSEMPPRQQPEESSQTRLSSDVLVTSSELPPTQQPEELSQTSKMDIDDVVNNSVPPDSRPAIMLASSSGVGMTLPETDTANGSLPTAKACSNPPARSVEQLTSKDNCQTPTGLKQSPHIPPPVEDVRPPPSLIRASGGENSKIEESTVSIPQTVVESANSSTTIQPNFSHADPLAGVTDDFMSEVAQAIAEGEAGTGSKIIISRPSTTPLTTNSNSSSNMNINFVRGDSEIMEPLLKPTATSSSQLSKQDSASQNRADTIKVEELKDSDGSMPKTTTPPLPISIDDARDKVQPDEVNKCDDTKDREGREKLFKNSADDHLGNRPINLSIDPVIPAPTGSSPNASSLPPPPPAHTDIQSLTTTISLDNQTAKDNQLHQP